MSQYVITTCEMCSANFRIHRYERPHEWQIPPDWFTLFEGELRGQEGWNFCSLGHLLDWVCEQMVVRSRGDKEEE